MPGSETGMAAVMGDVGRVALPGRGRFAASSGADAADGSIAVGCGRIPGFKQEEYRPLACKAAVPVRFEGRLAGFPDGTIKPPAAVAEDVAELVHRAEEHGTDPSLGE